MRIKCTLNLSPCNYSAVVLQICRLSSAVQQHFQILPKEENTVFLMKGAKCLVLAPAVFIHQFHKYSVIVVVAQSPIKKYFHVKQNQYQSNKEQRSSVQHVSVFLCFNTEMRRLSCQVTGTIFRGRKGIGELCGMLELQRFGQKWLKKKKICLSLSCPSPPSSY